MSDADVTFVTKYATCDDGKSEHVRVVERELRSMGVDYICHAVPSGVRSYLETLRARVPKDKLRRLTESSFLEHVDLVALRIARDVVSSVRARGDDPFVHEYAPTYGTRTLPAHVAALFEESKACELDFLLSGYSAGAVAAQDGQVAAILSPNGVQHDSRQMTPTSSAVYPFKVPRDGPEHPSGKQSYLLVQGIREDGVTSTHHHESTTEGFLRLFGRVAMYSRKLTAKRFSGRVTELADDFFSVVLPRTVHTLRTWEYLSVSGLHMNPDDPTLKDHFKHDYEWSKREPHDQFKD
jgi:hypothetical protein